MGDGDAALAEALFRDDATLHFPGRNPFAGTQRSGDEVRRWLRRLAHFRPRFDVHDVIAAGAPWDMRACVHFTDMIGEPDDQNPYVNEGVWMVRLRWGRIVEQRVFLDTQSVADFFGTEAADEFFADAPITGERQRLQASPSE